jgi:Archaeal/vacuolar-type H+-ATPase subunit C
MSTAGGSNPEYVSARVRSRRAKLFDEDQYRDLVRMGPSEIARFMEESEYSEEINRMGSRYSGVDLIEYSLNRNLARHFADVLRFAEGRLYDLVARYLRKFDVWNVKTVVRGLYSGATPEEIRADLILAGELDAGEVDKLIDAGDVEGVVEALEETVFANGLEDALADFEATSSLVPIENAIDRAFYENL